MTHVQRHMLSEYLQCNTYLNKKTGPMAYGATIYAQVQYTYHIQSVKMTMVIAIETKTTIIWLEVSNMVIVLTIIRSAIFNKNGVVIEAVVVM